MRSSFCSVALGLGVLGASLAWSNSSSALTVYIGTSNGGSPMLQASGSGFASINDLTVGTWTVSAQAQGTPPLSQPDLNSTTLSATTTGAGTLDVFVSELGLTAPPPDFLSSFTSNTLPSGRTLTESTYLSDCMSVCDTVAPFVFQHLLSEATFTAGGFSQTSSATPSIVGPLYELTQLYDFTATGADTGASGTIDMSATLLTAALPLFAGGLGVICMFARRKKRTTSVLAA